MVNIPLVLEPLRRRDRGQMAPVKPAYSNLGKMRDGLVRAHKGVKFHFPDDIGDE
jgi:hypothetical protein